ncbi:MAG: hypothetical protein HY619_07295 [Thaumarchaeota archaeon]|nr:hypothetical protein [Nitrososphaerota archaeon]
MDETKILKEFADLQSEIREDKIKIELDPVVSQFVDQLFEQDGWACYFHIIANCLGKGSLVYYSNTGLKEDKIVELLARSFSEGSGIFADILSKYLEQSKVSTPLDFFQNFVDQGALKLMSECLEYCSVCDQVRIIEVKNREDECPNCSAKLFHIMQASLPEAVRAAISNGQLLEIYVKKCLQKAGFRVISKTVNGAQVSTSIPYSVYAIDVEIDVGAVEKSSLFIFECKTGKLVPSEVAQKLAQLKLLIDTINRRINGLPDLHVIFVVLGEIDKNVEPRTYETAFADLNLKSCQLIPANQVAGLVSHLLKLKTKV